MQFLGKQVFQQETALIFQVAIQRAA